MSTQRPADILFLAHRIPYPPDRGDKIRSFNIVRRLSEIAPVHIATFADDDADAAHAAGLREALGGKLASLYVERRSRSKAVSLVAGTLKGRSASMAAFSSRAMRGYVDDLVCANPISTVFAFSGQMAQYASDNAGKTRFVMDFVDVDSAKMESYARDAAPPLSWLYAREAAQLAREERVVASRADVSLFVTDAEAALFRTRCGAGVGDVRTLENGVDLAFFDLDTSFAPLVRTAAGPVLVFSGQMDYAPNVAAVSHFARETLPLVRRDVSDATFAIVGRNPAPAVRALDALEGVEVVGAVPDMRPWLSAADVVVAPLQIARGIQNKILEAMAMGRPVVASPAAFEGIDAEPGRDLLVTEHAAAAVLSLLRDPDYACRLGSNARSRMCARYAWDRQLAALSEIVTG